MKKLFNQHKKKIFYTLGTLFILNLALLVSNRGILIGEDCLMQARSIWPDNYYHHVDCSQIRTKTDIPHSSVVDCKYWMGRGTFTARTIKDYCNFTKKTNEIW